MQSLEDACKAYSDSSQVDPDYDLKRMEYLNALIIFSDFLEKGGLSAKASQSSISRRILRSGNPACSA
jgi:hypothetical protein